ncbi:unnamed protein product [Chrysoparadoxa australica]
MTTVIGVAQHQLWYHQSEGDGGRLGDGPTDVWEQKAQSWSHAAAATITLSPEEYSIARAEATQPPQPSAASATPNLTAAEVLDSWTPAMDERLVCHLSALAEEANVTPFDLPPSALSLSIFTGVPLYRLQARVALLLLVNDLVLPLLPVLNFSEGGQCLAGQVLRWRHLLFGSAKKFLLRTLLQVSATREVDRASLEVLRGPASESAEEQEEAPSHPTDWNDAARRLQRSWLPAVAPIDPHGLRCHGGAAFGDVLARLGTEVEALGMLRGGAFASDFTVNPRCINPLCPDPSRLMVFRSLGILAGVALRSRCLLPVELPEDLWTGVAGEPPSQSQPPTDQAIDALLRLDELGVTAENYEQLCSRLVCVAPLRDGQPVEVLPGGSNRHLSYQDTDQFVNRLRRLRDCQSLPQVAAYYAGFTSVVPRHGLVLLTARELKEMMCA